MQIAIVGANRTRSAAPFWDRDWVIWTCSPTNVGVDKIPRADAWFEIHPNTRRFIPEVYYEWLKTQPKVYMRETDPNIPGSVVYPKDEIVKEFGPYFFTSTISWMLALAIKQSPIEIGMWGIDLGWEWEIERPAIWHFVQTAQERGINVSVPSGCKLLDPPFTYGFDWESEIVATKNHTTH